ncbi:uncharacterized protein RHOBADRAFT_51740 [Rhodotorula graminis WP1]|uniref:Uncharacterized protein n=1 Tax=Rhodotorula graminis (strain WP1) TaxID=578459 RepID=A0A194S823_RHOGW|nr:uncharacterized protein RHOBADRAFT_51740 [Rhodotorula graminis WP1]KPV76742.1 hypothetical protein RHOBADRAFT_51740 [Rhodotorula graminis WP1]
MAEPLSSWSLSRHLSRFHRAADAKTVPVAAMKHRIEAFMQYWDGRSGSWSTLVPGGDELWTGRIDFPGEADDMFLVMEKKPVVVHDADVLLTGVLHGARVPFCSVPSLGETARSTIEVPRTDAAPDRWQFLRLEGEGGAPSAASWRFLGVRGDPKSDVYVSFRASLSATPKPARRLALSLWPERRLVRTSSTSFALEGPSDRIAAFVRQPDGGELFAFRGVGSGVDEAEVVELPTAPHAARSFVVSLQGTWRLVTPQHAVRTCVPDCLEAHADEQRYRRWAFVLPGAEDEVGKVVEVEASAPRPISSPSSALAPAHPDTWTLARRTLSRHSRRLVSTTWTVSLSAVVLASASSSAAAAGRCSVTFRADDPHEVRAREGGDHGAGRGIASGGGRERLPVWAEMTSGRR